MPITHSWNGTILTITSDSGTSSADLKGAKGDDGARGAQGLPGSSLATDASALGGVAAADYALKTYVDGSIDNLALDNYAKTTDLEGLATETYVDTAIETAIADSGEINLDAYATKEYVNTATGAIQDDLSSNYALKTDIPNIDLAPYATTSYVNTAATNCNSYTDVAITNIKPSFDYNYLDNSDFRNPINQRDITEAASGNYIFDRWLFYESNYADNVSVATNNTGTTVSSVNGTQCGIIQRFIDKNYVEDGYSLFLMTDAGIQTGFISVVDATNGIYQAEFWFDSGTKIIWAAMYKGTYTIDNCPPYKSKGYAAELQECKRYFRKHSGGCLTGFMASGSTRVGMVMDVPMRIVPTITISDYATLRGCGKSITPTGATVDSVSGGRLIIILTYASQSGISNYAASWGYGAEFTLSADL